MNTHTIVYLATITVEDMAEILNKNYCCLTGHFFHPWSSDLSILSPVGIFGTRDLFNISYSRELYLFSKFLHFEEIVRAKMAVCFEMIVSET